MSGGPPGDIARKPSRRTPSLRASLNALQVGALLYVAVVGLILIASVGPAARRVQQQSRGVITEYRESERNGCCETMKLTASGLMPFQKLSLQEVRCQSPPR